jgi:hypothetical protein
VSQVSDELVMVTRKKRALTGRDDSLSKAVPPVPLVTPPAGKVRHAPLVGSFMASSPVQYCTSYLRA